MLGPIVGVRDGTAIRVGGRRQQALLGLLAVEPGRPIPADRLIDELWDGEPPQGAAITLRSYISRLRTSLGNAALIVGNESGYALNIDPERVDRVRFERLIRKAEAEMGPRHHRRAAARLCEALGLWQGLPFGGLATTGVLSADADRLDELRLRAVELRLEVALELGAAEELVDELEGLVRTYPFREAFWRQLMLALYRAARQADALAAYHRARVALDDELGLEPGADLRALEGAILRQEVPEPIAEDEHATSLPASLTTFIGRDSELRDVATLLDSSRLVSLVGVGGVGKTRLAIEAARRFEADLRGPAAFVDLASIANPGLIAAEVAAAIGVRETPSGLLENQVADALRHAEALLVLDNCEHLLAPVASLVAHLLASAPDLRILATTRVVLGLAGEAVYPVPTLGRPRSDADSTTVRSSDSVRLLLDRALLARHGLEIDDAAIETAARIVAELEGLPLAIELAAAHARALSLDEIATRLHDRFTFLVSSRRLVTARHQTLREAMAWSFGLLGPDEQRFLTSVSVFPGDMSLASAAAVGSEGDEMRALELLGRLIDASLVIPSTARAATRYRMLETVRQYVAAKLDGAGFERLRRLHAERTRDVVTGLNLTPESSGAGPGFEIAGEELASIRSAIAWATAAEPALALEIAVSLERYYVTNHAREALATYSALLENPGIDESLRARGLRCRGGSRAYLAQFEEAAEDYREALRVHERRGERAQAAHMKVRLAVEADRLGDTSATLSLLEDAVATAGDERYLPDRYISAHLRASIAFREGRVDEAFRELEDAREVSAAAGDQWWLSSVLTQTAEMALDAGRLDQAGRAGREGLALARRFGDTQATMHLLALLAAEAAARSMPERAGSIWGGIDAESSRGGALGQWVLARDSLLARVANVAGPTFELARAEGRLRPLDAAIDAALSPS